MAGRRILAATLAIACYATAAAAQTYPTKPIKLIVPYTPGSPVDVLARVVTQQVSARLGQSIVIDNRPGAGTTIGTNWPRAPTPTAIRF
jgi:tripartite-type tricarboxylate transporter receptor subunit TctC